MANAKQPKKVDKHECKCRTCKEYRHNQFLAQQQTLADALVQLIDELGVKVEVFDGLYDRY